MEEDKKRRSDSDFEEPKSKRTKQDLPWAEVKAAFRQTPNLTTPQLEEFGKQWKVPTEKLKAIYQNCSRIDIFLKLLDTPACTLPAWQKERIIENSKDDRSLTEFWRYVHKVVPSKMAMEMADIPTLFSWPLFCDQLDRPPRRASTPLDPIKHELCRFLNNDPKYIEVVDGLIRIFMQHKINGVDLFVNLKTEDLDKMGIVTAGHRVAIRQVQEQLFPMAQKNLEQQVLHNSQLQQRYNGLETNNLNLRHELANKKLQHEQQINDMKKQIETLNVQIRTLNARIQQLQPQPANAVSQPPKTVPPPPILHPKVMQPILGKAAPQPQPVLSPQLTIDACRAAINQSSLDQTTKSRFIDYLQMYIDRTLSADDFWNILKDEIGPVAVGKLITHMRKLGGLPSPTPHSTIVEDCVIISPPATFNKNCGYCTMPLNGESVRGPNCKHLVLYHRDCLQAHTNIAISNKKKFRCPFLGCSEVYTSDRWVVVNPNA